MSDSQVQRLSALLSRVQQNRQQARGDGSISSGSAAQNPPALAAAAAPRAQLSAPPDERSARQPEVTAPPPPPPRRPAPSKASPLEIAFAGELERDAGEAPTATTTRAGLGSPELRREPARAQVPQAQPSQHPALLESEPPEFEEIVPHVIEPDPPREIVRPIAQLFSKHAPPVDASFGAMLKRSLSLRPH
jgi:hypothetical protein